MPQKYLSFTTITASFALVLSLFSVLHLSPLVFHQFDTVCKNFNYQDCMKFYWRERGYYQSVLFIAGPITILGLLASIGFWSQTRQHPTDNHRSENKTDRPRHNQSRRQKSKA